VNGRVDTRTPLSNRLGSSYVAAAPREIQAMLPPLCDILQIHLGVFPPQLKYKCTPPLSIFPSEFALSRVSDTTGSGQTPNSYFKSW